MEVVFHSSDVDFFPEEQEQSLVRDWISAVLENEKQITTGEISIIFCSDQYLLEMNQEYLGHHYFTDIITFPYSETPLTADLFISVDRVRDNADQMDVDFTEELRRVMIHGVLHLCDFADDTEESQREMRQAEDKYLQWLSSGQHDI